MRVEATFAVGEYKIEVLSARDSTGLEAWLRQHDYAIPAGAERLLRPYVQAGMYFFVAKVDIKKVRTIDGKAGSRAILSPLRFHYDSPNFTLPVRLGLINAGAVQDLIVHVLARGDRYEVANYANIAIPTNIDVHERTRDAFGQFYAALFDRVSAQHPGAVVTEYAWSVTKCDPCPAPPLDEVELATLGADVLPAPAPKPGVPEGFVEPFAITRLHARYGRENLGQDMVFRSAPPIVGGLDASPWADYGPPTEDRFQARYVIRHPWEGPIDCANPNRGVWGPPPDNVEASPGPVAATGLAFVARSANLAGFLAGDTPMRELLATATLPPGPAPAKTYAGGFANVVPLSPTAREPKPEPEPEPGVTLGPASAEPEPSASGCSRCSVEPTGDPYSALAMGLTLGLVLRRRQRGAP